MDLSGHQNLADLMLTMHPRRRHLPSEQPAPRALFRLLFVFSRHLFTPFSEASASSETAAWNKDGTEDDTGASVAVGSRSLRNIDEE